MTVLTFHRDLSFLGAWFTWHSHKSCSSARSHWPAWPFWGNSFSTIPTLYFLALLCVPYYVWQSRFPFSLLLLAVPEFRGWELPNSFCIIASICSMKGVYAFQERLHPLARLTETLCKRK